MLAGVWAMSGWVQGLLALGGAQTLIIRFSYRFSGSSRMQVPGGKDGPKVPPQRRAATLAEQCHAPSLVYQCRPCAGCGCAVPNVMRLC